MSTWIKLIPNWARNSVYAVTLSVIGGLIVEYLKEYPIPGAIWNFICLVWDKLIELITIDIKLWWVLTLIVAILILRYITINIEITKAEVEIKKEKPQPPRFLSYKREIVDKIPWEWSWEQSHKGWAISNFHPCCPKDGARLNQFSDDCPICKSNYWGIADHDKAAAIIENKLKREFPNDQ